MSHIEIRANVLEEYAQDAIRNFMHYVWLDVLRDTATRNQKTEKSWWFSKTPSEYFSMFGCFVERLKYYYFNIYPTYETIKRLEELVSLAKLASLRGEHDLMYLSQKDAYLLEKCNTNAVLSEFPSKL